MKIVELVQSILRRRKFRKTAKVLLTTLGKRKKYKDDMRVFKIAQRLKK